MDQTHLDLRQTPCTNELDSDGEESIRILGSGDGELEGSRRLVGVDGVGRPVETVCDRVDGPVSGVGADFGVGEWTARRRVGEEGKVS